MTIRSWSVKEAGVEWDVDSHTLVAIVRDGEIESMDGIMGSHVNSDADGCVEFIQAIKIAMKQTL